jgi:hypothetical protein
VGARKARREEDNKEPSKEELSVAQIPYKLKLRSFGAQKSRPSG